MTLVETDFNSKRVLSSQFNELQALQSLRAVESEVGLNNTQKNVKRIAYFVWKCLKDMYDLNCHVIIF